MGEFLDFKVHNNKFEEVLHEDVYKTKIIALLFTATWCSPCTIFEKELLEIYNEANIGEKVFEIIHISFDKTEESFKKSMNKPWLYLPYNDAKKAELIERFEITSIPMFLVLNSNGAVLTDTGRKEISEEGIKVIDKWLKNV